MFDVVMTPFSIREIAVIMGSTWSDFVDSLRTHGIGKNVPCRFRSDSSMDRSNYFDILELSLKRIKLSHVDAICDDDFRGDAQQLAFGLIEDFVDRLAACMEEADGDLPSPASCLLASTVHTMVNDPFGEAARWADEHYEDLLLRKELDVSAHDYEYAYCCAAVSIFRRSVEVLHKQEINNSKNGKVCFVGQSTAAVLGKLGSFLKVSDCFGGATVFADDRERHYALERSTTIPVEQSK